MLRLGWWIRGTNEIPRGCYPAQVLIAPNDIKWKTALMLKQKTFEKSNRSMSNNEKLVQGWYDFQKRLVKTTNQMLSVLQVEPSESTEDTSTKYVNQSSIDYKRLTKAWKKLLRKTYRKVLHERRRINNVVC